MTTATPRTIEAITPAWLTSALAAQGCGTVTSVRSEPVGQGVGILCLLHRLFLEYEDGGQGPRTLVAKLPASDPATLGMVAVFRFYEREVRFYRELAADVQMPTPRCYYAEHDPASNDFALLLEDLGGARLGDQLAGPSPADTELIVDHLAALHASLWGRSAPAWMPALNDPANKAGLALYPMAWPVFMERVGHAMPAGMASIGEALGPKISAIQDLLAARARTIGHGDARLDNMFFATAERQTPLTMVDWQIAMPMAPAYDLGYFISQSLDPEIRRATEQDLLRRYHERLRAGGVSDYSYEDCLADYRWALLFCFVYPVIGGGMGELSNERGYALATAMTNRCAAAVLDWDAGALLNEVG